MSSTCEKSPTVTSPLRPTQNDPNQTTPTSIKRPRLMQGKQGKTVRFADTCDEIPAANEVVMSSGSLSLEDYNVRNTRVDTENYPATEQDKLSGRLNQPENFVRTSPRKNAQATASPARLAASISVITGDTSSCSSPQIPSPLTPRRSAMKRKAQESLDVYEHSAQTAFRSPARRPGSANSSSTGFRLVLSDTNIEASQEECIYPSLRRCTDGVTSLCLMMAETSRTSLLARTLREQGITTIGKFASLTPSALEQIPYLKRPKYDNAVTYLKAHIPNNIERESPVTSQERVNRNVTETGNQSRIEQSSQQAEIIIEKQSATIQSQPDANSTINAIENRAGQSQTVDIQTQTIKVEEEEAQHMFVSPSPEHGVPSLDEDADAQPIRSPWKNRSAPTTPRKDAPVNTPQKMVIPPLTPTAQTTSPKPTTPKKAKQTEVQQASGIQSASQTSNIQDAQDFNSDVPSTSKLVSVYVQTSPETPQVQVFKKPKLVDVEQQTTPLKKPANATIEQQTTPVKSIETERFGKPTTPKKDPVHFNLEDSSMSVSEITSSQVGTAIKKRVADLTRLVNDAFPPNANKPKLTVVESVRNLQADFQEQNIGRSECSELVSLLLDFAKMVNDKASTLEK